MDDHFEVVANDTGYAVAAFKVWAPEGVWLQKGGDNPGLPGHVEFKVCEVTGAGYGDGNWLKPIYNACEPSTGYSTNETDVFDDAEAFAEGSITWDGCINWVTNCQNVMHHHCELEDLDVALNAIRSACEVAYLMVGLGDEVNSQA